MSGPIDDVLLAAQGVTKSFAVRGRRRAVLTAVDDVSLDVRAGETLGLVGESGCGKSTLGRCLVRLADLSAGRLTFAGRDITELSRSDLRPLRRDLQMVFQDPYASLNPRRRVGASIGTALRLDPRLSRAAAASRVRDLLELVGLRPEHASRFPHEFSGGQRQRIGIARALATEPKLIVADEPVSSLDVSIQAQVVNLFADLKEQLGLTYVFIAHDLSVVRQVSDRVAVMYLGALVEIGPVDDVVERPLHPYTQALLSAVLPPELAPPGQRPRITLAGEVPSPVDRPSGCRFHPRCRYATDRCRVEEPLLTIRRPSGQAAACHYPLLEG